MYKYDHLISQQRYTKKEMKGLKSIQLTQAYLEVASPIDKDLHLCSGKGSVCADGCLSVKIKHQPYDVSCVERKYTLIILSHSVS